MPKEIVILIHGIRTEAAWAEMVAAVLESDDFKVIPIRYGYFDVFRFWSPFFTRKSVVNRIVREIRDIRSQYPSQSISVIAHSFGTYAITEALKEHDIKLNRVILCGSIVRNDFRRAIHSAQLSSDPIVNDCGTNDIWPILAKSITWGYGSTGAFGFGTNGIYDRFHKYSHSQYFDKSFVENYWKPFIYKGEIIQSKLRGDRSSPPYWHSAIGVIPLKYISIIVLLYPLYFLIFPEYDYQFSVTSLNANHWVGTPLVAAHIRFKNNTFYTMEASGLTMTLTDPNGEAHHLAQEPPLQLGVNFFNHPSIQVPAKNEYAFDYTFIGSYADIANIVDRAGREIMSNPAHAANPVATNNVINSDLSNEIIEKYRELNVWKSGKWKYEINFYLGRDMVKLDGSFVLTGDREVYLRRITRFYSSGIGVLYPWRTLISANEQTWVNIDPIVVSPTGFNRRQK